MGKPRRTFTREKPLGSGEKEEGRQNQVEDDPEIGILVVSAEELHYPMTNHGHAGCGGDCSAGQADGIVAEEQGRPNPVLAESIQHFVFAPNLK